MNLGMAVHNAPTDHGGIIPSTMTDRASVMGKQFVRAGDGHVCPKCKVWSTVKPSHDHVIFDGQPVAYVNDELTCGARILEQQTHTVGNSQSLGFQNGFSISDFKTNFSVLENSYFNEKIQLVDEDDGEPIANVPYYLKSSKTGEIILKGISDSGGYTERFYTDEGEKVDIYIGEAK